jgi:hypothetical protein
VIVDAPGHWYFGEMKRILRGSPLPVAVTQGENPPDEALFSYPPRQYHAPIPAPPLVQASRQKSRMVTLEQVSPIQLRCLRVLARIRGGTACEVASLAQMSEKPAREALRWLTLMELVEYMNHPPRKRPNKYVRLRFRKQLERRRKSGVYRLMWRRSWRVKRKRKANLPNSPVLHVLLSHLSKIRRKAFRTQPKHWWRIRRAGKILALRSWGIPPGVSFKSGRERAYLPGWRHARTSRLALDWVRRSGQAQIWAGWSEVSIPGYRVIPDALLWGVVGQDETLFWVEVQGGSKPKKTGVFLSRMKRRYQRASEYAEYRRFRLVFIVLGKEWALEILKSFLMPRPTEAILLQNWLDFGKLPTIVPDRISL